MLRLARLLLLTRLKQGWQALRILQKSLCSFPSCAKVHVETYLPTSMSHCQQWCLHCFGLYCTNDFP